MRLDGSEPTHLVGLIVIYVWSLGPAGCNVAARSQVTREKVPFNGMVDGQEGGIFNSCPDFEHSKIGPCLAGPSGFGCERSKQG